MGFSVFPVIPQVHDNISISHMNIEVHDNILISQMNFIEARDKILISHMNFIGLLTMLDDSDIK